MSRNGEKLGCCGHVLLIEKPDVIVTGRMAFQDKQAFWFLDIAKQLPLRTSASWCIAMDRQQIYIRLLICLPNASIALPISALFVCLFAHVHVFPCARLTFV